MVMAVTGEILMQIRLLLRHNTEEVFLIIDLKN